MSISIKAGTSLPASNSSWSKGAELPQLRDAEALERGKSLVLSLSPKWEENFYVCLETPSSKAAAQSFDGFYDKVKHGKTSLTDQICYATLIGSATFPDNSRLSELGAKWIQNQVFADHPLLINEKIELAHGMGQKIFPDSPRLAAIYAAECFRLKSENAEFEMVVGIFMRHYELPTA